MRKFSILLALLLVFSLAGCGGKDSAKADIFDLVEENSDAILEACTQLDVEALEQLEGITRVHVTDGYILVYCTGSGISPSSQDHGFYYAPDGQPVAVFDGQILCGTDELTPEGDGFVYLDSGHNRFYTEHIMGNLYYYSASF